jgi:hypothetical protein
MIHAMLRSPRRIAFAAAVVLAAACGGQSFTTVQGDGGADDGTIGMTGDEGTIVNDGPTEAIEGDAAPDSTGDALTISDGPSSGDAAMDVGPIDAFVPDVIEEPPPHCGGAFACVPSVPAGWSGPFEVYSGASASPPCSANFAGPAYDGNGGLTAKAASCACTCTSATGVSCSSPEISFYANIAPDGTCATAAFCADLTLAADNCTTVDVPPMCAGLKPLTTEMTAGATTPIGGTCTAMPSEVLMPYSWGVNARACVSSLTPARVDCAAGSICAPEPVTPFGSMLCVSQTGTATCPTSGYTTPMTFYGGVDDGRTCTGCSCGAVAGAECSGSVTVSPSTNAMCTGNADIYLLPFSCDAVQQPADFRLTTSASGGTCSSSAVTAAGAATPTMPTTFCCLP